MDISKLLKQVTPSSEPIATGEWGIITFRPDLGSQQQFIVGAAISIAGDTSPHIKWLPSLTKLCSLYNDAISIAETSELLRSVEYCIRNNRKPTLQLIDTGTPHITVSPCGYIATDDVEAELIQLLKRQSGMLWAEREPRDSPMDDDWAYSQMRNALNEMRLKRDVFLPGRSVLLQGKSLRVALDNDSSYGNIVSARYSHFHTVERHIFRSLQQVMAAHKLANRQTLPTLFVVLPERGSPLESQLSRKSTELLEEVEDMGALQFCDPDPASVADKIATWASA